MQLPQPGDTFEDRYRVDREIGEGGFARVYAATDVGSGVLVALKVLKPDGYDRGLKQRFDRELRALSQLVDPHTVRLLDHGQSSGGLLFAVFEYIDGRELRDVLDERGQLEAHEVEHLLRQLLASLGEAHDHGIVHRDLKPENVMVFAEGPDPLRAKLLDFGIARPMDGSGPSVTRTGELIGTPRYMSPEQLTEKPLTPASDIYSLGLIAFELSYGRDALHGGAWSDQLDRLHTGHLFSVPEMERVGPRLHGVMMGMTARKPQDRFQTARQVLAALDGGADRAVAAASAQPLDPKRNGRLILGLVLGVTCIAVVALLISKPLFDEVEQPVAAPEESRRPDNPLGTRIEQRTPEEPSPPPVEQDLGRDGSVSAANGSAGCDRIRPTSDRVDGGVLYVPESITNDRAVPLIMLLHDKDVRASDFLTQSGFKSFAKERGFIVVAPQVPDLGHKLTGEPRNNAPYANWQFLEPERLNAAANAGHTYDQVVDAYCVDLERVFVVGHGAGARGAEWLGCEPWVKGLATNSRIGEGPYRGDCKRRLPHTPLLRLSGRHDGHHRAFGARTCQGADSRPLNKVDEQWERFGGCTTQDPAFEESEEGHRCRVWQCADGRLESCLLDGGRPWPGTGPRPGEEKCDGLAPEGFDVGRKIVDFLLPDEPTPPASREPQTADESSAERPGTK